MPVELGQGAGIWPDWTTLNRTAVGSTGAQTGCPVKPGMTEKITKTYRPQLHAVG
jgi:hypothetical protein